MNFVLNHFILALGVLSLDTANSLCPGDHAILTHNTELYVDFACRPGTPDTEWEFTFAADAAPYANINTHGWCVDGDRFLRCNDDHYVDVYSSYDTLPAGAVDTPGNFPLVNWLINNYPIDSTLSIPSCSFGGPLTRNNYQMALWGLIDTSGATRGGTNPCIYNWLIGEAQTHGVGYEVSCDNNEKIGVILVVDNSTDHIQGQVVMAEIDPHDVDGVCDCDPIDGNVGGDPHFTTWSGELYDFHGICDLVLLKNPNFMNGLGMDINVRSKKMKQVFSYVSSAVIRIGSEKFEVSAQQDGDTYWLNGKQGPSGGVLKEMVTISGYPITFHQASHSHKREYVIDISEEESIVLSTWKSLVRVDVKSASKKNFHGSLGLLGSFDKKGAKVGRDGVTVFDDVNQFGMEWQVLATEDALFHEVDGPQHPAMCEIPSQLALRRRLVESRITFAEAELACSRVNPKERDLCAYDVMATNDKDVAGAY